MEQRGSKRGGVSGMKDSLYSREHAPELHVEERTPLPPGISEHPAVSWPDTRMGSVDEKHKTLVPVVKRHMLFGIKFLITSIVFFCIAMSVALYVIFVSGKSISPQNIDIQVLVPSVIDGGKQTTFEVVIHNRNQSLLQLADLSIEYPEATRQPGDQTRQLKHERQSIGMIQPGEQIKRTASAVFYGQEGTPQKVLVTLQYSVPNSNSIFQKQAETTFTVGSSPISILVQAQNEAISDQQFSFEVTVTSNAALPIDNVVLEGQYPFGYALMQATPSADFGTTLWRLGALAPGQSKKINLVGKIIGQDGDERVFRFLVGSDADQTNTRVKVPFIIVPQTLTVHKPFIAATLTLNGKGGKMVAIESGKPVSGLVEWQNNLSTPVSNVEVVLSFAGPALDKNSLNALNGFYQSLNNTITWSADQNEMLATVPPGGTGTLHFSFSTNDPGADGTIYTNPTIDLNVMVSGVREGQAGVPEVVSSAASVQASVASAVVLTQNALHFTGPFRNTGPMPPIAEQPTTYTVLWTVTNSSNTLANAVVSTILPTHVQFVGGQDASVTFDKASRTVSWAAGDIKAGAGYSAQPRTMAFQVSLLPSTSQVGQTPNITGVAKLTGQDRFAQVILDTTTQPATTMLAGDQGFQNAMGIVAPKN